MLPFDKYNELIEIFNDDLKLIDRKIDYRRMELRKAFSLPYTESAVPTPQQSGCFTISASSISGAINGAVKSFSEDVYENDAELGKLKVRRGYLKARYEYLKQHGELPD